MSYNNDLRKVILWGASGQSIVLEEFLNRVFFNNDPEKIKIGKMDKDISDIIKSVRNKIIERMMYFFPNTKKAISKSKMTKITMESLW